MSYKLDKFEQEIEKNFEKQASVRNKESRQASLRQAAVMHLKNKKSITLRVSTHDIEAIKIKASKLGLPYQTYINSLIHQDATRP